MDAVQKANSGHPGAPMGMADIAEVLWNDFIIHNPSDPSWSNRDRFVLSNGHGSMLLYSLLHLSGYDLSIEDLKNFRQLHSKTPGHPEFGYTPGVETTTGPLGQGLSNAVGMALAEKILSAQFNRKNHKIIDHKTYCFLGDGCLMEGISHEVSSFAGTQKLGKLIVFYDDNGISIDGEVNGWFTDNTPDRYRSYGWQVIPDIDGHDHAAIKVAIRDAHAEKYKPTLICCKTLIGYGSPNKQGKEDCHGAPLGESEVALARDKLKWQFGSFEIPSEIYASWNAEKKGSLAQSKWDEEFKNYRNQYPELCSELERRLDGHIPEDFSEKANAYIYECQQKMEKIASRKASQNCLNIFGPLLPELLGGSADLAGSNLTIWSGSKGITSEDASGNYLFYGVREFGMSGMMNGITLHGGFIAYGATFLIFMEYARNAVRMAALMKQKNIFVYTHDSVGLGEDGPTHQPVEQLTALRSTPNLETWRPCDTVESAVSWKSAIERDGGPSALIFSRQSLTPQTRSQEQLADVAKGGYILKDPDGKLDAIIIATGSEVEIAVDAAQALFSKGVNARVISMPCAEIFSLQDLAYRERILPSCVRVRVAVEAGHSDYWYKYVGIDGKVVGMTTFGESAPGGKVMEHFGFTVENVVNAVLVQL
jgi:transketolase